MTNPSLFDAPAGERLQAKGIAKVRSRGAAFLVVMRSRAFVLARAHGSVTSDDLRKFAEEKFITPHHPNVWGAVFKGRPHEGWRWVADGFTKTKVKSGHARMIRVWKVEPDC